MTAECTTNRDVEPGAQGTALERPDVGVAVEGRPALERAFCFCDIEGSTRLAAAVGDDAFADLLRRHREVLRECISRYGGDEVQTEGDGTFVVFEDVTAAVS